MGFEFSAKALEYHERITTFMNEFVYSNEELYRQQLASAGDRWSLVPIVEDLKAKAKAEGLWNLFFASSELGQGLSNLDYAPLAEIMGRVTWSSEIFNCSPPDTGNMEVLERYGTPEQKERWLQPLLEGEIRSAFAMTEPDVASSDATNVRTDIRREGGDYVINGRKWYVSGAGARACKLLIVMGKTDPGGADVYRQQSMILVPMETPGVRVLRNLSVMGFDDAPHGHAEIEFDNVRVPAENILLGEGRGFEIAQGRLGPGRIHHCMRIVGQAELALEKMCRRLSSRTAFGRLLSEQSVWMERVAEARIMIDQARLLTLNAAEKMDRFGNREARKEIAMIKVAGPKMLGQVVDWAIQAHGAAGVSDDFGLARQFSRYRGLRLLDGPDEVHRNQIAKLELRPYRVAKAKAGS